MTKTAKTTRKSRSQTGTRKQVQWRPPNALEVPEPPAGYKYRWIRHELRGEDQASNIYKWERQGYTPVRPSELGDDYPHDTFEGGKHEGVVRSGDVILAKVPLEIVEQRNAYYRKKTEDLQKSVDIQLGRDVAGTGLALTRDGSSSSVTRGDGSRKEVEFED